MEWIDVKKGLPSKDYDFENPPLVTDGEAWGYGTYKGDGVWSYRLHGCIDEYDDRITHWAIPPELPRLKYHTVSVYFTEDLFKELVSILKTTDSGKKIDFSETFKIEINKV